MEYEELTQATLEAVALWPGSDRQLAAQAGISRATLRRIRQGEHGITPKTAAKILAAIRKTRQTLQRAEAWLVDLLE
ncbi:MAG: helix-turn-helix domain-containing protein [Planctomycetota bacterium]|jgi:transcriptional regulator with XRE-family HTH domain